MEYLDPVRGECDYGRLDIYQCLRGHLLFPLVFSEGQGNTMSRYGCVDWCFDILDATRFVLMSVVFNATVNLLLMFD